MDDNGLDVPVREHREKFCNYLYLFYICIIMVVAIVSHEDYNRFIYLDIDVSSLGCLIRFNLVL